MVREPPLYRQRPLLLLRRLREAKPERPERDGSLSSPSTAFDHPRSVSEQVLRQFSKSWENGGISAERDAYCKFFRHAAGLGSRRPDGTSSVRRWCKIAASGLGSATVER